RPAVALLRRWPAPGGRGVRPDGAAAVRPSPRRFVCGKRGGNRAAAVHDRRRAGEAVPGHRPHRLWRGRPAGGGPPVGPPDRACAPQGHRPPTAAGWPGGRQELRRTGQERLLRGPGRWLPGPWGHHRAAAGGGLPRLAGGGAGPGGPSGNGHAGRRPPQPRVSAGELWPVAGPADHAGAGRIMGKQCESNHRGASRKPNTQIFLTARRTVSIPPAAHPRRPVAGSWQGSKPAGNGGGKPMADIRLRGLTKRYGNVTAVDSMDLEIPDGEFFALLGPSGCGKTTTMRLIAGLEQPTAGTVHLGSRDVTHLPPQERNVAMVFQDYALYPHMTVFDNIAYPLKVRKVPRAEIAAREIGRAHV